jgi:hypothetical protein
MVRESVRRALLIEGGLVVFFLAAAVAEKRKSGDCGEVSSVSSHVTPHRASSASHRRARV